MFCFTSFTGWLPLSASFSSILLVLFHIEELVILFSSTVDVPVYRPPVYRFALFTGVFFSCHPVTPIYRWYAGIPGWLIFSCSRSPSCCCTLPHTLLHTTQHNTLGVAASVEQRTIFVRRKWILFMRGPPNQPCRPTSEQCFLTHNWYSSTAV